MENVAKSSVIDFDNSTHFIAQSKGGAGKTIVATIFAQYLKSRIKDVHLYDTDANNKTFGGFESLDVVKVHVLNDEKMVDQAKFDDLLEKLVEVEGATLTDTGSGEFRPIINYMISTEVVPILEDSGKEVIFHVPVTFDESVKETFLCLSTLIENFPTAKFIVWKNNHHAKDTGQIDFKMLSKKCPNIIGYIDLLKLNPQLEGVDFSGMIYDKQTFDEFCADPSNKIGIRQRMKRLKEFYYKQLDNILLTNQ